jgi:hypothetical protein
MIFNKPASAASTGIKVLMGIGYGGSLIVSLPFLIIRILINVKRWKKHS